MARPEVETALQTREPELASPPPELTQTSDDGLQDPLVDPMSALTSMAPPVEQPLGAESIQQVLSLLSLGMSSPDPAMQALHQGAFGSVNALLPKFHELEVMIEAGALDPLKAVAQRTHLLTMLDAHLGAVPDTDPRMAAFKARVKKELAQAWEMRVALIQQQADAAQKRRMAADRKTAGAIKEALTSAVVE